MKRFLPMLVLVAAVSVPFAAWASTSRGGVTGFALCVWSALGWTTAASLFLSRKRLHGEAIRAARSVGLENAEGLEVLLASLFKIVKKKNTVFLPRLLERRISSKDELSRTLEEIVVHAYRLLDADSAELALFDADSGLYHSAFVLGRPFRRPDTGPALKPSIDRLDSLQEHGALTEPLAFGGTVMGSMSIVLKSNRRPAQLDRELVQMVALQATLALINAQYADELKRMTRTSEESVKAKTGFLANLSHEIRGPLGIILNAVELVLDGLCGPLSDSQRDTLGMVKGSGSHLLELINDVLDYARVESGKVTPNKEPILLAEILKDMTSVVRKQAEAKRHKVILQSPSEALSISCDRRHLRQMLINLLTNAIKYTPEGGVITFWAERAPAGKIRIVVKDSGIGISEPDRAKVFAAFERIENSYALQQLGTGLGMPLTKRLAEVNGGSIDFSSQPGSGSEFWLLFPAVSFDPTAVISKKEAASGARGKGEAILLVESDSGERDMLSRYLTHMGFLVKAAASQEQALILARQSAFRLILLDNQILEHRSEDVLKLVTSLRGPGRVPVVLMSSRAFAFDVEQYLKQGVDRCVPKPVSLMEIGKICRSLIDETGVE